MVITEELSGAKLFNWERTSPVTDFVFFWATVQPRTKHHRLLARAALGAQPLPADERRDAPLAHEVEPAAHGTGRYVHLRNVLRGVLDRPVVVVVRMVFPRLRSSI